MSVNVIDVQNLSFAYNGIEVLSDISFTVAAGDYVGFVGPNGSGKTTLLKLLLGISASARGSIRLFDHDLETFRDWHKIGYLPQKLNAFNPHFPSTVREIVALGLISKKTFPKRLDKADRMAIDRTLERFNIQTPDIFCAHIGAEPRVTRGSRRSAGHDNALADTGLLVEDGLDFA